MEEPRKPKSGTPADPSDTDIPQGVSNVDSDFGSASLGSALLGGSTAPHVQQSPPTVDVAELIERLSSPGLAQSQAASRELLEIGEPAVLPLLDALQSDSRVEQQTRLGGALVALGDLAVPELQKRLAVGVEADTLRPLVQLAGAIGSSSLSDELRSILHGRDPALRVEAAGSLARIGGSQPAAVLVEAIGSPVSSVAMAAARGLGTLALRGYGRPIDPLSDLLAALNRTVRSCDAPLAREVMRTLVRMNATEAVPALRRVLQRAPLRRRTRHRSIQRLAIEALSRLTGDEALQALEAAARRGQRRLRRHARKRLAERALRMAAEAKHEPLQ